MIHTRFTAMFGLTYPVMSAPMALHSGGTLAGAVSAAGGLGTFGGMNPAKGPRWLLSEIDRIRIATPNPYGIGFITPFLGFAEELFDAALSAQPAAVVFSFADPAGWTDRVKQVGAKVICQVQTFDDGSLAIDAGADVLIAQGTEGGGHTGLMGMLPLLVGLVSRHPQTPVLAAGGIGGGSNLAAALVAGADGALVGTAFLATHEAVEVDPLHKRLIVESDGADTVFTRTYDIVSGQPWPEHIGARMRRNRFTDEWTEREAELRSRRAEFPPAPDTGPPTVLDPDTGEVMYGQSAGSVTEVRSAAVVVHRLCDEAEAILRSRPASLLSEPGDNTHSRGSLG